MIAALVSRVLQLLIVLAGVRVMTTLLPPEEVGKVSLIGAATTFCALLLISPLGNFVNRRLHAWQQSGVLRTYFSWYSTYLFVLASFGAGAVALAVQQRYFAADLPVAGVALIVWVSLFCGTLQQTYVPSLNMLGHNSAFAVLNLMGPALGLVLSAGFVWWFHAPDALIWLFGVACSQIALYLLASRAFFSRETIRNPLHLDSKALDGIWRFTWPIGLTSACVWLQFQGYRFVLADYAGYATLGYFVAGYGIAAGLFGAFEQVIASWFMPRFYRQVNGAADDSAAAWSNYAACVLPLSILCFGAVFSLADFWVASMLGPAFQSTQGYVQWGAMSEWFRVTLGVYGLLAHQSMRTRTLVLPQFIGALVTSGLVFWVATTGEFRYLPLAFAGGSFVSFVWLRFSLGRVAAMSAQGRRWMAAATACSGVLLLLCIAMRDWFHPQQGACAMTIAAMLLCLWIVAGLLFLWLISRTWTVSQTSSP